MATVAPYFTTRVGSQVVSHQSPDSLALRNWAQVRDDPRARFKESYNPLNRGVHSCGSQYRYDVRGDDAIANAQVEQLQLEIAQARSEIQNLRSALHYAGLALQGVGNWDKLPPELRIHLDAHHRMVDELTHNLKDRDQEILKLNEKAAQSEKLLKHQRHVLLKTVGDIFGSGPLLLAWTSWQKLMRQKDKELAFQDALKKCRGTMKPTVLRTLKDLAASETVGLFRVIFQRWCTFVQTIRHESEKKRYQDERAKTMVQMWAGNRRGFGLRLCWSAWLDVLAKKHAEAREEELRRQHLEDVKKSNKESIMRSTLALANAKDKQSDIVILKMFFRVLLENKTESQIEKQMDAQAKLNQERKDRAVERQALLLWNSNSKVRLATAFAGWRDIWQVFVDKKKQIMMDYKRDIMHLWITVFKNGARSREIKKLRQTLKEEEEKALAEEKRLHQKRFTQKIDLIMISKNEYLESPHLLLRLILSAWKEDIAAGKVLAEKQRRAKEKEKWEEEWLEEEKKREQAARARLIAVGMNAAKPSTQTQQFLLKMAWFAWKDVWKEEKRYNGLDDARRVLEDDLRIAAKERDELAEEKKQLEARHHKAHEQRLAAFLWVQSKDSSTRTELLLRIAMSSWKECVEDIKEEANRMRKEMKDSLPTALLSELQHDIDDIIHPGRKPGCFRRWIQRWCCCCCRCCPCKCCRGRSQQVAPLEGHIGDKRPAAKKVAPVDHSESRKDSSTKRSDKDPIAIGQGGEKSEKDSEAVKRQSEGWEVTRKERTSYLRKITVTAIFFYLGTITIAVVNAIAAVLVFIDDSICPGALLDWYIAFSICACADVFALVNSCCWIRGAVRITNMNFVYASDYAKRMREGEDQLLSNYHAHLKLAAEQCDRGSRVCYMFNLSLKIGMALIAAFTCFLLVASMLLLVSPSDEPCDSSLITPFAGLFGFRLVWSLISMWLPNYLAPPYVAPPIRG